MFTEIIDALSTAFESVAGLVETVLGDAFGAIEGMSSGIFGGDAAEGGEADAALYMFHWLVSNGWTSFLTGAGITTLELVTVLLVLGARRGGSGTSSSN